ncbi:MAG: hypothetical protein JW841_02680 [Deltaproteobacteria bacterium]|nr:hypothetical protein [Deltaproteobacteria bacterium]
MIGRKYGALKSEEMMLRSLVEERDLQPVKADDTAKQGQMALENFVLDVLFNPANREGSRFRGECLAWRDAIECRALKKDMLADAQSFTPGASGWERFGETGNIAYAGRLAGFFTTVRFIPGGEPEITIDLDEYN